MKYLYLLLLLVFTLLLLRINIKLHAEPESAAAEKEDILQQLNFLEAELLQHSLGDRMQHTFPEGFVFVNALYGLAWCELALADAARDTDLRQKALGEALWAYQEINSDKAKATFSSGLEPEKGIFYEGWRNYLLSKILSVDSDFEGYAYYTESFKSQSKAIADALRASESPFLESYPGQAWPADMFLGIASLQNHDKIFAPEYADDIALWLQKVAERLDPATGMIPHKTGVASGRAIEGPRGGSMALMLRMLHEIDPVFAAEQYGRFKANFVATALTLPSVREYPAGTFGLGDIDSGPVILGVGPAATIVAIGVLPLFGDGHLGAQQYLTVNAFGMDYKSGNEKQYLFGQLPMADAFVAWSRASALKATARQQQVAPVGWQLKFHLLSLAFLLLLWWPFYKNRFTGLSKSFLKK